MTVLLQWLLKNRFFDSSLKRHQYFEHLLSKDTEVTKENRICLCKMTWVERHTCSDSFKSMYVGITLCLRYILNPGLDENLQDNGSWDAQDNLSTFTSQDCVRDKEAILVIALILLIILRPILLSSFFIIHIKEMNCRIQKNDDSGYSVLPLFPDKMVKLGDSDVSRLANDLMFWGKTWKMYNLMTLKQYKL
ncbi:uncharacterized protein LOC125674474 [Ostrea edulis]|uniref:uncharacterized protein LOC125674474 n=1 Tax=Ostrea edulis TaxID=37623 RepID=UPI00209415E7|nr:uncharacterized protein LOC125674474 [Ostrea edulis]